MCLNVPTSALIQIQFQALDNGWVLDSIISNMLFYWKLMRRTAKDRDKVHHLSCCCTECAFINIMEDVL